MSQDNVMIEVATKYMLKIRFGEFMRPVWMSQPTWELSLAEATAELAKRRAKETKS